MTKKFKVANVLNNREISRGFYLKYITQVFIIKFAARYRNQIKQINNGIY